MFANFAIFLVFLDRKLPNMDLSKWNLAKRWDLCCAKFHTNRSNECTCGRKKLKIRHLSNINTGSASGNNMLSTSFKLANLIGLIRLKRVAVLKIIAYFDIRGSFQK